MEFAKSFEEASPSTPIFFILSPGVNPLKDVEQLGKTLGYTEDNGNFHNVSLGQGQEVVAEVAMDEGATKGHWVILQVSAQTIPLTFIHNLPFRTFIWCANGFRLWRRKLNFTQKVHTTTIVSLLAQNPPRPHPLILFPKEFSSHRSKSQTSLPLESKPTSTKPSTISHKRH